MSLFSVFVLLGKPNLHIGKTIVDLGKVVDQEWLGRSPIVFKFYEIDPCGGL